MVQWVKILLAKSENLNSISRTMWWKGLYSHVVEGSPQPPSMHYMKIQ